MKSSLAPASPQPKAVSELSLATCPTCNQPARIFIRSADDSELVCVDCGGEETTEQVNARIREEAGVGTLPAYIGVVLELSK